MKRFTTTINGKQYTATTHAGGLYRVSSVGVVALIKADSHIEAIAKAAEK